MQDELEEKNVDNRNLEYLWREIKPRSVERSVDQSLVRQVSHALDLVEVEGVLSRQGTVEPGLQERCPVVSQHQLSALIILADSSDPRVHPL